MDFEEAREVLPTAAPAAAAVDGPPAPQRSFACSSCGVPKRASASKCTNVECSLYPTVCSGTVAEESVAPYVVPENCLGKRQRTETKRFIPVEYRSEGNGKPKLKNYDNCFVCHGTGELLACDQCPQVYHLACLGLTQVPKGCYRCPVNHHVEAWGVLGSLLCSPRVLPAVLSSCTPCFAPSRVPSWAPSRVPYIVTSHPA